MNIGILSTGTHPLICSYLLKLTEYKIKNFILILDNKKISKKDIKIFTKRTKNYFNLNYSLPDFLREKKIEFIYVDSHNGKRCLEIIKKRKISLLVNCGTPRKIDIKLINSLKHGILNVHPGILPKYRGRTCLEWSIFNNEKVGNSLHLMDENYDTGNIIKTESYMFSKTDNYYSIRIKVYEKGINLLVSYLKKIQRLKFKKIKSVKQNKLIGKFYDVIDYKKFLHIKRMLKNEKYKYQI